MNRRIALISAAVVAAGALLFIVLRTDSGTPVGGSASADSTTTGPDPTLTIEVDPSLGPEFDSVAGLDEGDPPRPLGRISYGEGDVADVVIGELIVATANAEQLAAFLERNDGELIDTYPGVDGEPDEHLVRIPIKESDPNAVAGALSAVEEGHEGLYEVSDPHLLTMLLVAATEKNEYGLDVFLNTLLTREGIAEGEVEEADDRPSPFEWTYMMVGGPVDSGVTGAWQLLSHHGKLDQTIKVMIADGGFFDNDDFPDKKKIRLSSWNVQNPGSCSGGNACPWHGTDVALTAVAKVDNEYGTAGVAGPVGELIAVQSGGDFWTEMRNIKRMVEEERPAVVNMSFGGEVKTFRAANEASANRHLKAMRDYGAVVIAAAGNEGKDVDGRKCVFDNCYEDRLVIPCESRYAICVGGTNSDSAWLHEGSNHGTDGGSRSVQIYAPYCVVTLLNPASDNIDATKWTCGTSFSAPFVAGAAALVKAADPSLGPTEIWDILRETANVGGVHFDHYIATEHQLRVNVLDAVAMALGVEQTGPTVSITSPRAGEEFSVEDWIDLDATALDFKGEPLEISWQSSQDGHLGTSMGLHTVFDLTPGEHTLTATVMDVNGVEGSASIKFTIVDHPPDMSISWPAPGTLVYETDDLSMVGSSEDPDTYQSLGDGNVEWEIMRNGQVVWGGGGHVVEMPGGTLQPGEYEIVFRGYDSGGIGETTTDIVVLEVIGNTPVANIVGQFNEPYSAYNGQPAELTLVGEGFDVEDGQLPGTQFRWRARADNGHEEVLCTGSNFTEPEPPAEFDPGLIIAPPTTQPGGFIFVWSCAEIDVELGLAPGAVGSTVWAIVLEVVDSDGQVATDVEELTVVFVTG